MNHVLRIFTILTLMAALVTGCDLSRVKSTNLTAQGMKQYNSCDTLGAMQSFREAIKKNQANDQAYYRLAQLELTQLKYAEAKADFEACISLRPNVAQYWYMLGKAQYEEAIEMEDTPSTEVNRERLFRSCTESFKKAVELDPAYAEAHLRLARCHLGNNNFEEAVLSFEESIKQNPKLKTTGKFGTGVAFKELGILYANYGFYEEAEAVFRNGLRVDPSDIALETEFANVYQDLGRYNEAAAHFEAAYNALEARGGSAPIALPALFGAGVAHYSLGREAHKLGKERESHDEFVTAEKWFSKFTASAGGENVAAQIEVAKAYINEINTLVKRDIAEEEEL